MNLNTAGKPTLVSTLTAFVGWTEWICTLVSCVHAAFPILLFPFRIWTTSMRLSRILMARMTDTTSCKSPRERRRVPPQPPPVTVPITTSTCLSCEHFNCLSSHPACSPASRPAVLLAPLGFFLRFFWFLPATAFASWHLAWLTACHLWVGGGWAVWNSTPPLGKARCLALQISTSAVRLVFSKPNVRNL